MNKLNQACEVAENTHPSPSTEELHANNPVVGDCWSEMDIPVLVVLEVFRDHVIACKTAYNDYWRVEKTSVLTKKEFHDYLSYKSMPGYWAHCSPSSGHAAVVRYYKALKQKEVPASYTVAGGKKIENGVSFWDDDNKAVVLVIRTDVTGFKAFHYGYQEEVWYDYATLKLLADRPGETNTTCPSKRKWWRYFLKDGECPKRVLDYDGRNGANLFDTVEAYTREEAMAVPWVKKVKRTVNAVAHVAWADLSRTTVFAEGRIPRGTPCQITYEDTEEIK